MDDNSEVVAAAIRDWIQAKFQAQAGDYLYAVEHAYQGYTPASTVMAQFAYSKVVSKSSAGIFSLFSTLNTDIADLERQLNDLIEGLVDDNQVSNIVKPVASQIVLGALDEATTDGLMGLCECGEGQLLNRRLLVG